MIPIRKEDQPGSSTGTGLPFIKVSLHVREMKYRHVHRVEGRPYQPPPPRDNKTKRTEIREGWGGGGKGKEKGKKNDILSRTAGRLASHEGRSREPSIAARFLALARPALVVSVCRIASNGKTKRIVRRTAYDIVVSDTARSHFNEADGQPV